MADRQISQRSWRLLQELREASGRKAEKSPEQIRAEANARLDELRAEYRSHPLTLSDGLKKKIGEGR